MLSRNDDRGMSAGMLSRNDHRIGMVIGNGHTANCNVFARHKARAPHACVKFSLKQWTLLTNNFNLELSLAWLILNLATGTNWTTFLHV